MTLIFEWLLVYAAKASLLCSAVLLLLFALRRFSAASRSGLIVACSMGVLLLPLVSGVLPPISLSALFNSSAVESVSLEGVAETGGMEELIGHSVDDAVLFNAGVTSGKTSEKFFPLWKRLSAWIWLLGIVISLIVYLSRIVSSFRLGASSMLMQESSPLMREFLAASVAVRLNRRPEIRISSKVPVPFAIGFGRNAIILPAGFGQLPAEARRAVLLHECAHLRRRDEVAQLLIAMCRCVHWFNPLFLFLDRAFNAEAEKACDDLVISAGISSSTYSETILYFCQAASKAPPASLWVGAVSGYYPSSRFDRDFRGQKRTILARIRRIVDPAAARRTTLGAVLGWLLVGSATVSASILGAFVLVPDYEWEYQLSERALPHADNLIASWRMDQVDRRGSSIPSTPDSVGGMGDGQVFGAKLHSEGRVAKAMSLDGNDDYIDMGSKFGDLQYPITLSAWVRTEGQANHISQNIVWLGSGESTEYVYIGLNFGKPAIKSRHGEAISKTGKMRIDDGKWHHIAGVFLSEGRRLLYSDGELVAEDLRFAPKPRLLNMQVGRNGRRKQAASYTRGSVDDVRVYGVALEQGDIRAIMAGDFALIAARHEVGSH